MEMLINASSSLFRMEIQTVNQLRMEKAYEICEAEAIAISLIISELLINALKHHGKNQLGKDSVSVELELIEDDEISIRIINTMAVNNQLDDVNKSNVGMSMIEALMPPKGADIRHSESENLYEVNLVLTKPVLSKIESVQVIANDKFATE